MKNPFDDSDEPEEIPELIQRAKVRRTELRVGDIEVNSTNSLNESEKIIKSLLKDKEVKNYLQFCERRKLIFPSYTD